MHLLPPFDELIVGYADRRALLGRHYDDFSRSVSSNGMFSATVLAGDRVVGTWKRSVGKRAVSLTVTAFEPLDEREAELQAAADRYGAFLGLEATVRA